MAKAQLSVLLEELSGAAGTSVFVRGKTGTTVRARASSNQPDSPSQVNARRWLSIAAAAYQNLTSSEVLAWETFATPPHSANNAFVALTAKFLQIQAHLGTANPFPTSPPATPFQMTPLSLQITAIPGAIRLLSTTNNPSNTRTELLIQRLPSPNRKPRPRNYVTATFANLRGGVPTNFSAAPGVYAVAIRYVLVTTGESTKSILFGTIQIPA